ncbi:hypothetical protein KL921_001263 [Ogataea angusta]|uniref:Uncharacterized protein n=1 Tax=Pichia angusta TaxID=870730 RepID=A0AAN6DK49_PICAN|nr:uncharacterized protein KL928_001427 [Ogataea angusta]KAG7813717.1 hypothetical protein KL921_001263 [Ogataea angusta]KAG7821343.1 hypothetical protein KL928_001427 [Ogataea angusta]KAG7825957.1 hypothetical protein KL909_000009 [Ogataea angusta]KAG7832298.1 hypothetical protein KL920_000633 [Ogataea angusta]KAG7836470.1 hypothetical protein KL943_002119 [Ogataea angusta]
MYSHPNLSASSTGSYSKRLSSNNPFRSAILQEESRIVSDDSNYRRWLEKHAEEGVDSDNENLPPTKTYAKPELYSANSESSM